MALTRKMLSAMEIEPGKVSQIIDGHTETVNALQSDIDAAKAEASKYKADAEKSKSKLEAAQKELDELKAKVEADAKEREGKDYDKLLKEFEDYKSQQEKAEKDKAKTDAFKSLLSDLNVSDKGVAQILKWQGIDGVELDEDGKIANARELRKAVKEDWGEYIETENVKGAETATPPANAGGTEKKSKEEIASIKSAAERQKIIAEQLAQSQ